MGQTVRPIIASGTVAAGGVLISAVNGTAFIDVDTSKTGASDFSTAILAAVTHNDVIELTSKTNGKKIYGYAKAAGSGETLDATNIVSSWTNGANAYDTFTSVASPDIAQAVSDGDPANRDAVSNACTTTAGKLYKMVATLTVNSGQAPTLSGTNGFPTTALSAGVNNIYFTATGSSVTLTIASTAATDFALTCVLKQVNTPSAAGITITNSPNGITYNFGLLPVTASTFYNDAAGYTYRIISRHAYGTLQSDITTPCAWYNATYNYPKGCNNNALRDSNDSTVVYASDGYSNCGRTGSGIAFAKTTHNGQNSGVADLNGLMYEVSIGVTCIGVTVNISGISNANPCEITTSTNHGLTTNDFVRINSISSGTLATAINDKIWQVTVTAANKFTIVLDSTALAAWVSGGTVTRGTFYAAKKATAMKSFTHGNSGATDHWGATGVAAMMDAFVPPFKSTYAYAMRMGSGTNQVLSEALSGAGWNLTGMGFPQDGTGMDATGTELYGKDYFYQCIVNELCLIVSYAWGNGTLAGVWGVYWNHSRSYSNNAAGFRLACYPANPTPNVASYIGTQGMLGFGVGICPTTHLPTGMTPMDGYNIIGHENYGNYKFTDGSIMVWIPKFYYKYESDNTVSIKGMETYADEATANVASYAMHRMFWDGGVEQPGVFIDKYKASKVANGTGYTAASIKNGLPLSSASTHNPFADLTGGENYYYSAVDLAHRRDGVNGAVNESSIFFVKSQFIHAGLALLSLAHGQDYKSTYADGGFYIATVDGGAMFFHDSIDFSAYAGTDAGSTLFQFVFYDNAGKSAQAFAGAVGGGEALGSEIVDAWTNYVGHPYETWTPGAGNTITQAINSSGDNYGICNKSTTASVGALYKLVTTVTVASGASPQFTYTSGAGGMPPQLTFGSGTLSTYKTATDAYTYFITQVYGASDYAMSAFSLKKLTDVPATGLHLMSAKNGTTRNMKSVESGFSANAIVRVNIYRAY